MKMPDNDIIVNVVKALAEADKLEPHELDINFSEYLEPEVLEMLDSTEGGVWQLTVRVSDHQVTVTHGGQIFIDGVKYRADVAHQG